MRYLPDVIEAFNATVEQTPLADFYKRRRAVKRGNNWSGGLLKVKGDIDGDLSGYAFHFGGLSELQFNIGFEEGAYFRYGVAFSIQPNRNVVDPASVLRPKILAFNAVLHELPVLRSLAMWWYDNGTRTASRAVEPIPVSLIRSGVFIFIGERVPVGDDGVTPAMLKRAAEVMASLLPLYERVEGFTDASDVVASASTFKVARLCWSTNGWQGPSGRLGKVGNQKAFEGAYGFGHEEWLLDHSRLVDGWKYGFIQALNHSFDKYAGKTIDLLLYTIDNKTKRRYWVASISGVEVLTEKQSSQTNRLFEKNGWLDEMREQVQMQGLDDGTLSVEHPQELLNLRYRPDQCVRFDPMIEFPADELPAAYYGTFQQVPKTQAAILHGATHAEVLKSRNIGKLSSTRTTHADVREIDLVHKRWQKELGKSLQEELPGADVIVETKVGGYWVDIVIDVGGKRILVELKTCTLVRQAIREALSQLLEYAYWPPSGPRGDLLLIVCAGKEDEADREYMRMLRDCFGIPVHYLQYREGAIVDIPAFVERVTT
jgi:hypothetical protein